MLRKKFNPGVSGAAVIAACGFILLYHKRPISPAEAKTLHYVRQYFLFSGMLPAFDFDMPLYYFLAHFASFSKETLNILRMFSSLCAAASLFLIYRFFAPLRSLKEEYRNISFAGFFAVTALSLIALCVSGVSRAAPDLFVFATAMLSFAFFARAFIAGDRSAAKFYLPATMVALYSAPVSFVILPAQLFFLKKFRDETSSAASAAVRRAAILFIPGLCLFAISFIKVMDSIAPGKTLFYVFHSIFLDNSICFSLIGMSLSFAAALKKSSGAKGVLVAIIITALASAIAFISYIPKHGWKFRETRKYITNTEFTFTNTAPVIILFPAGNDGYYYSELGRKQNVAVHIVSSTDLINEPLKLGAGFNAAKPLDELGKLKELFLLSETIRVIDFSFMPTSGQTEIQFASDLTRWALSVTDSSCSDSNQVSVCAFTLTESRVKDGVLLDLLINHYGDYEGAVRLITDETFSPSSLGAYYHGSPSNLAGATEKLLASCGDDSTCKRIAHDKITAYANHSKINSIRAALGKTTIENAKEKPEETNE